jgi:uncharacterized protein YecE (DUF72 family)
VGTSGWAYASWKPDFYPKQVPAKKFLEHYATRLNSVEVNYTFRALPSATQLGNWLAMVGEDFRFSFKAPQAITHFKRLKECGDAVETFLRSLDPVREAGRMGCVLFQLPPNFKVDVARLKEFLALPAMKHAGQVAFEFRHDSWFCDEVYEVLRAHDVAVCIAESDELVTPESFTAGFSCYRLRVAGGYKAAEVKVFAKGFAKLAREREVYVYFKHEEEPAGPLAAEKMLQEARAL